MTQLGHIGINFKRSSISWGIISSVQLWIITTSPLRALLVGICKPNQSRRNLENKFNLCQIFAAKMKSYNNCKINTKKKSWVEGPAKYKHIVKNPKSFSTTKFFSNLKNKYQFKLWIWISLLKYLIQSCLVWSSVKSGSFQNTKSIYYNFTNLMENPEAEAALQIPHFLK